MKQRHFEDCEEMIAFATMRERIYTMVSDSDVALIPEIAEILEAIGSKQDAEDIIVNFIDKRIEVLKNAGGKKAVHELEEKIREIYNAR